MTGWVRSLDELAAATAALLQAGPALDRPLQDPWAAMACRDAVLAQLRELVGAISDVPRLSAASALTVTDLVQRPGQALHQALSGLPRAVPFGTRQHTAALDATLTTHEQHWHRAAQAATGLEGYLTAVGQLPDQHAWYALRDLADIAAALPGLDHSLSEAIRPGPHAPAPKAVQDLAEPYAMLTHPGHDAVRLAAHEIRARVPAMQPRGGAPTAGTLLAGGPARASELSRATFTYVQAVRACGARLSVGDMRAVSRLLACGGAAGAQVLERAAPVVAAAAEVATGLRRVGSVADRLRLTPACSISTEHLGLLRDSRDLQSRLRALALQERQLPTDASERDLRRLAPSALAFAEHIPMLARALHEAVSESLADGLLLVPSAADRRNTHNLMWVTNSMRPGSDGPPPIQQVAVELAAVAEDLGRAVSRANRDLARHAAAADDPARRAAALARRHAGTARAELRAVLGRTLTDEPPALSAVLPSHPRLTAPTAPPAGRRL